MNPQEIKDIRCKLGLTQIQLADKLGVTNMSIHKWEHGISRPHKVFAAMLEELAIEEKN